MNVIGMNFKKSGEHFRTSVSYFAEALAMVVILGLSVVYHVMNGRFFGRRLKEPYSYVWRTLAWGVFTWMTFTCIVAPLFAWWDGVMAFFNHIIWG